MVAGGDTRRTFAGVSRRKYDSSEAAFHAPVSLEELDWLMGEKARPLADKYDLRHFLYRVRVTLHNAEETNREALRALEAAREQKRRHGAPTTLTPMDAVRYASPEELAVIVGNISSSQLTALQAQVSAARELRASLARDLDAVRGAAEAMAGRADIPAGLRAEFVQLLNSLPAEVAEVSTPKSLELAQMAGVIPAETPPETTAPETAALDATPTPLALPGPSGGSSGGSNDNGPESIEGRELPLVSDLPQYAAPPPWRDGPGLSAPGSS